MGYFSVVLSSLAIVGFLGVTLFVTGPTKNIFKFLGVLGIGFAIVTLIRSA
jgi:hypothetical protein